MNYTALNNIADEDNEDAYLDSSAVEPLLTAASDGHCSVARTTTTLNVITHGPRARHGLATNRRDYRKSHAENWGRIRLGILSSCFVFLIYICFSIGIWVDQRPQIVVNIPPMDESLPGPRGISFCALPSIIIFFFVLHFYFHTYDIV